MFGFENAQHMYKDTSPHFRVEDIDIPVVALNSADDPFCPETGTNLHTSLILSSSAISPYYTRLLLCKTSHVALCQQVVYWGLFSLQSNAAIPEDVAHSNPNLVLVTTRRGGHIGFMDGLIPTRKNLMDRVLMQFVTVIFESQTEL